VAVCLGKHPMVAMAKEVGDFLQRNTQSDEQAGGAVAQLVRCPVREPGRLGEVIEPPPEATGILGSPIPFGKTRS
jgi:hypothetical protein